MQAWKLGHRWPRVHRVMKAGRADPLTALRVGELMMEAGSEGVW